MNTMLSYLFQTEFRFFWGQSKLQEELEGTITEVTRGNKYCFELVASHACTKEALQSALTTQLQYKVDGLLFYHKRYKEYVFEMDLYKMVCNFTFVLKVL